MQTLETKLAELSEMFRDHRLNLKTILRDGKLPSEERFAVAIAAAAFTGHRDLCDWLREAAEEAVSDKTFSDALAASAIMSMNTVYYRSVHMLEKPAYQQLPPGLRMNRMMKPETSKRLFELCSLACAALAGCQRCLTSHETTLRKAEVSEAEIHEAVRIAAIVNGVANALRLQA